MIGKSKLDPEADSRIEMLKLKYLKKPKRPRLKKIAMMSIIFLAWVFVLAIARARK